jgi:predicted nucleotide-binding protein (sugar kinase/HSP70/actin superfamily)
MVDRVGIYRAALAFRFWHEWRAFFHALGVEPILAPATTKRTLDTGIRISPSELCLPMKAAIGQVKELADAGLKVLLPRFVGRRVGRRFYFGCPKYLGFPDMVRALMPGIDSCELFLDERRWSEPEAYGRLARGLGAGRERARRAVAALDRRAECRTGAGVHFGSDGEPSLKSHDHGPRIMLVGHNYLLFDRLLSTGLLEHLQKLGAAVVMPAPPASAALSDAYAASELNWYFEIELLASVTQMLEDGKVDGVVLATSFACGTGVVTCELVRRMVLSGRSALPLLMLLLDEHTGEAGLGARLEAFLDVLKLKRR